MNTTENMDREHAQIFLQPVAGASILGFFAFAAASFVMGAQLAGWQGFRVNPFVGPFFTLFFGLAQFAAAMWAFRSRDGVSTAFHGIWGAFWLGFGALGFFSATRFFPAAAVGLGAPVGYVFLALAFISAACAASALASNFAIFCVKAFATAGSFALAIGLLLGGTTAFAVGGYFFMLSAVVAWYCGTAMVVEDAFGRAVLPVGEFRHSRDAETISDGVGEPGVLHGEWKGFAKKGRMAHS